MYQNFIISYLYKAQHVLGDTPPIIRRPKTALAASGFSYVEGCWTCSCWMLSGTICAWQRPPTTRPTQPSLPNLSKPSHLDAAVCQKTFHWMKKFAPRNSLVSLIHINPLKPELNPICYLLALLGAHHFLHISRIRVKLLTFRLLMS